MFNQFADWLAAEARAGRGGIVWPETIVRGLPFSFTLAIPADVSGDTFKSSLSIAPDVPTKLADFSVAVGEYADGITNVTFSLTESQVDSLPDDDAGTGLVEIVHDIIYLPAGGAPSRAGAFVFKISGRVTEND